MRTHCPENERIKHRYFRFLKDAKGRNEASIDGVAKALSRFEAYTKFRDFKQFHLEQPMGFKVHLAKQTNERTGTALSAATLYSTLNALKVFFQWLSGQPGYRSRIRYADAEYFNLSEKETRIAKAAREARAPTLDQILHVIRSMPSSSEIEQRDRALISFVLLTGIRHRALATLKIKHVDLHNDSVFQDARQVQTKFSKTFTTYFFPVEPEGWVRRIVEKWIDCLIAVKLWNLDHPLFPAARATIGQDRQFGVAVLEPRHWSSSTPITVIFRRAFEGAGLSYFNPHSFRRTLALLGQQRCKTPEEFKAWSQNLGHEQVLTTFASYGEIAPSRQAEIIRALGAPNRAEANALEQIEQIVRSAGHRAEGAR
jgi:integrase/recombinase XerD